MKVLFDPGGIVANGSQWLFVKYFYFHTYYIETESQKPTANMVIKTKHRRYQRFLCLKKCRLFLKEKIILKIIVTITIIIIIIIFGNGLRQLIQEVRRQITIIPFISMYCSPLHCHSSKPKFRFVYTFFCVNCCLLFVKKVILFPPTRQYLQTLNELVSMRQGKRKGSRQGSEEF